MLKARTGGYWPVRAVNRYEGLSGDFPAAQHVPQRTQEQQPAAQGKAPADPQGGQQGGGKRDAISGGSRQYRGGQQSGQSEVPVQQGIGRRAQQEARRA
mgnify:CR=1 FL=1